MSDLKPGDYSSWAYDINNMGQVVGGTYWPLGHHATLWDKGKMVDLGTLGGTYSMARAINDAGQVVGDSEFAPGNTTLDPFLWQDENGNGLADPGEMHDLNAFLPANSGWVLMPVPTAVPPKASSPRCGSQFQSR